MSSQSNSSENYFSFLEEAIKGLLPEYNHEQFLELLDHNPTIDYAFGAIFGSFIGDYLGKSCQFSQNLSEKEVGQVLLMKTGDTSLAHSKLPYNSQIVLNMLKGISETIDPDSAIKDQLHRLTINIGVSYVNWYKQNPTDITVTMLEAMKVLSSVSLSRCLEYPEEKLGNVLAILQEEIKKKNESSLTNGCMARSIGSAVFLSLFGKGSSQEDMTKFIQNQVKLTHSNQKIIQAQKIWTRALTQVITRNEAPDDSHTSQTISESQKLRNIFMTALESAKNSELQEWISKAKNPTLIQTTVKESRAEHGWELGMATLEKLPKTSKYQMKGSEIFKAHMKETLKKGGDTCANAGIVGSMLGGFLGFRQLPQSYLYKLMRRSDESKPCQNKPSAAALFVEAWKLLKQSKKL